MANYTIELKDIVALGHNIFDFPYAFYDEKRRREFEEHFIRHFYFREIGSPSVDRFKHYLRDKMTTVFPYYNKLLETSTIEYSVLDNYNMTESTTTTRENTAKSNGVSHSVGQIFEEHNEESEEARKVNSKGATSETVGGTSEKTDTLTEKSSLTEDGTHTVDSTSDQTEKRRFLDTPQGAVDLADSRYLTNLHHDTGNKTVDEDGTTHKAAETEGEKKNVSKETEDKTANRDTTGSEETEGSVRGSLKREQKDTADNNTRLESVGNQVETIEHHRRGNIGIDTDSDMIHKHIKLQKVLQQIELMFFDECEDLFMLIYE